MTHVLKWPRVVPVSPPVRSRESFSLFLQCAKMAMSRPSFPSSASVHWRESFPYSYKL